MILGSVVNVAADPSALIIKNDIQAYIRKGEKNVQG